MNRDKLALQSWEDVELSLGDISQLKAEKDKRIAVLKSSIAKLNIEMEEKTIDLDFQIRQHEQNIMLYARAHLEEIRAEKKKSKQFVTGIVKTKEEEKYLYPPDEELLAAIKEQKLENELIQKNEKPIKSAIKAKAKKNPDILELLNISTQNETNIIIEAF